MRSLWSKTVRLQERRTLKADIRSQNVVIGAGIAGILIAYLLQESGQEVIVLEANKIGSGQTKNTTAKITSQHGLIYHDMIKKAGMERAKGYAQANERAIRLYKEIITKEGIACQFEELPSFLYTQKEEGIVKLKRETEAAKTLGMEAEYIRGDKITELPFGVAGAVRFEQQAQFHPLEFINGLAEKLTIYEHTKVLEVDEHFVITENHVVVAENVIFATHYPFPIVPGYYFLRQHQSRSYVLALEGEGIPEKLDGMYYGIDRDSLSFRSAGGQLILSGSSHRTGKYFSAEKHFHKVKEDKRNAERDYDTGIDQNTGVKQDTTINSTVKNNGNRSNRKIGAFCYLREQSRYYYPNATETAHWAAQDCMPHDGIPFIGRFSIKHDNWYVATGFQKWGMSSAMVSAMMICDMITKRENPWTKVFTPQRILLRAGMKNFLVDVGESIISWTKGVFKKKGEKCSHMGCALHWNEEEQSWDCPCHGSRYNEKGDIIDGPAQSDIGDGRDY